MDALESGNILGETPGGNTIPLVQTSQVLGKLEGLQESVDMELLHWMKHIPYHSWGGAINQSKTLLLGKIPSANYSTIIALGRTLYLQNDAYWNDCRDRDFHGIGEAMILRLEELGYTIIRTEVRFYTSDSSRKKIIFPIQAEEPTPGPDSLSP